MNCDDYINNHWIKKQVWNNLKIDKHKIRFDNICSFIDGEGTAVDVGCACGHSTNIMKEKTGNRIKWFGVDFANAAVDKAIELFPDIMFLYLSEISGLLNRGQMFDYVVCSEVIEHVYDDALLVRGLMNWAKKRVIITTPCASVKDPGHLRLYSMESLTVLLKENGANNFSIYKNSPFYYAIIDI